jgi:3-isopropylmalate dehydrogenase
VLIRESIEGLFYTQGRGDLRENEARKTLRITRKISEKLVRFAFELAHRRKTSGRGPGRVTCVDKANVFCAFAFFRDTFDEEAARHPTLTADHAYVDFTALRMVENPQGVDVMVSENMFADILSDLGARLMRALGLAPSADIGDDDAVLQPCLGTAPDIAGQGIAYPFAMFSSAAMMLDWLGDKFDRPQMVTDGERLRLAVETVVANDRYLTRDLGGDADTQIATQAVLEKLSAMP